MLPRSVAIGAIVIFTVAATTNAQSGVFQEDMCSCSYIPANPQSQCVKVVDMASGMCQLGDCKAGNYKCDMAGTVLCPRKECNEWNAAPGAQTVAPQFSCVTTASECVGDPDPSLVPAPVATPGACVFSDAECSCSYVPSNPGSQCIRRDLAAGPSSCRMGNCQDGYKCDCLTPTHMCTRKAPCKRWEAVSGSDTSGTVPFECEPKDGLCVVETLATAPPPVTTAATTTAAPTTAAPTTAAPTTAAPTTTTAATAAPTTAAPSTTAPTTAAPTTAAPTTAAPTTAAPTTAAPTTAAPTTAAPTTAAPTTAAPTTAAPTTAAPATTTTEPPAPAPATTTEACTLQCPNCFVPSADCDACLPDTSLSVEAASSCNTCTNLPDDYCGSMFGLPNTFKCCEPTSNCMHDKLPSRGFGRSEIAIICAKNCDMSCDQGVRGICSALPTQVVDLTADSARGVDSIPLCSEIAA